MNELKWMLLKKLRCPPAEPAYNATPTSPEFHLEDIRATRFSELDMLVRDQKDQHHAGEYRRIVSKLFLAQRFCFGFCQVITLFDWILRILLCYYAARQLSNSVGNSPNVFMERSWWVSTRGIATVTASHVYGLLKGYR